jgi:hypothetical protein
MNLRDAVHRVTQPPDYSNYAALGFGVDLSTVVTIRVGAVVLLAIPIATGDAALEGAEAAILQVIKHDAT